MPKCGVIRESADGASRSKRILCSLTPEFRLPTLIEFIRDGVRSALKGFEQAAFCGKQGGTAVFLPSLDFFRGRFYYFRKDFPYELRF